MNNINKTIQKNILNEMKEKDISYGELGKKTNLSKSALQRYATQEDIKIPIDRLVAIANALQVPVWHLIGTENEKISDIPEELKEINTKIHDVGYKLTYDSANDILYLNQGFIDDIVVSTEEMLQINEECNQFLEFKLNQLFAKQRR